MLYEFESGNDDAEAKKTYEKQMEMQKIIAQFKKFHSGCKNLYDPGPVNWGYKIRRLHLCRRVKLLPQMS